MKKKTSALAIVVAVIFSIFLFPLIVAGGIGSGTVFSMASVFQTDREEDIYQSFVNKGGMDWVYDAFISGVEEGLAEGFALSTTEEMGDVPMDIRLEAKELFPRDQVETIVYDVYHAIIKGETYQFDLSYQKNLLDSKLNEYFETTVTEEIKATVEANMEDEIRKEYGEAYDLLSESEKQEILEKAKEEATKIAMDEAREMFEVEVKATLETEIASLEDELSQSINSIYDMPEWQELKELEAETGFSLTDRTELCYYLNLGGYLLLGLTGVLLVVLLLCHLFRPSGFFTAGAFSLITGGIMMAAAKGIPGVLLSLIRSEMDKADMAAEEFPDFIIPMIEEALGWCTTGFEKVGKIGLMAAVILILIGILLLVIRKNKTDAEPASTMEMQ